VLLKLGDVNTLAKGAEIE